MTDSTRIPAMRLRGRVTLDGETVYVNGMLLTNLIRAFAAPETGEAVGVYNELVIELEDWS